MQEPEVMDDFKETFLDTTGHRCIDGFTAIMKVCQSPHKFKTDKIPTQRQGGVEFPLLAEKLFVLDCF